MIKRGIIQTVLGLILAFSFCGCKKDVQEQNFLKYYYPFEELKKGLIYEYIPVKNDSLGLNYWYYSVHKVEGVEYLIGNNYNQNFEVQQFVREQINGDIISLKDYILYENHQGAEIGQTSVEILKDEVFPINLIDTTRVYQNKIKWDIPQEKGTSISINRKRSFMNNGDYEFEGKLRPCVIMKVDEHLEHFVEDDGYLEPEYPGVEIYAEGIGLVYMKKVFSEGVEMEYKLNERYSMEAFEKKYARKLSTEKGLSN